MTSDSMHDDEILQEMLPDFLAESDEILSSLNENVLELDAWARTLSDGQQARCDERLLNEMFRDAHTLKGLSAMLGLNDINALTHKVENVFDAARHDQLTLTTDVVELVFRSLDLLTQQIENLTNSQGAYAAPQNVLVDIEAILQCQLPAPCSPPTRVDSPTAAVISTAPFPAALHSVTSADSSDPFAQVPDHVDIDAQHLAIFIDETGAVLDQVTETLLAAQSATNTESLLIQCRKVKGSAAAIGLHRAALLAHAMEDTLQASMNRRLPLTSNTTQAMLRAANILRDYIDGRSTSDSPTAPFLEIYHTLQCLRDFDERKDWVASQPADSLDADDAYSAAPATRGQVVAVTPFAPHETPNAATRNMIHQPPDALTDSPLQNNSTNAPPPVESQGKPAETLRVDMERLDQLMSLAGELVINKARFSQIEMALKRTTASGHTLHTMANLLSLLDRIAHDVERDTTAAHMGRGIERFRTHARQMRTELEHIQHEIKRFRQAVTWIDELADTVHQLARVTEAIQKTVMDTRMVPIGPLFRRFKRVVRDIALGNEKEIQLVIHGENTELDKRVIDKLGDPLIHMVRNCADHGIETPAERAANSKPRQGTVTLDAFHLGHSILVTIADDGKGLDPDRIRNKAVQKGIVSAAAANKMLRQQLYQLVWEPGLSTAEQVTEVSGRGMGMDIVRSRIKDLNGSIELDSQVGFGTKITVTLPLKLATLTSLLVEIDGDVIAIPVEAVSEVVVLEQEDITTVHGIQTARIRGRVISVMHLAQIFSWNHPSQTPPDAVGDEAALVIMNVDGREFGLVADRLLGEQDIVIKSTAENYRNFDGISGASILGDGRVSLILDVGAVLEMSPHANGPFPFGPESLC